MRFFLRKHNRLVREKDISLLFSNGRSLFVYPVKMIYSITDSTGDNSSFKVMVVVSKKYFKRAVDRNLLRRRLREAFRLNIHTILDVIPEGKRLNIALLYVSKDTLASDTIRKSIVEMFKILPESIEKFKWAIVKKQE